MTEKEKMLAGEVYSAVDLELLSELMEISYSQQTSVSLINSVHITNSYFVCKDTTLL